MSMKVAIIEGYSWAEALTTAVLNGEIGREVADKIALRSGAYIVDIVNGAPVNGKIIDVEALAVSDADFFLTLEDAYNNAHNKETPNV